MFRLLERALLTFWNICGLGARAREMRTAANSNFAKRFNLLQVTLARDCLSP